MGRDEDGLAPGESEPGRVGRDTTSTWLRLRERQGTLEFLHGVWTMEGTGTTLYVDARTNPPRAVYCWGGDDGLTGVYEDWYFDGRQYQARFRWLSGEFAGYVTAQVDHRDRMLGGWWYEHDVPQIEVSHLPFVARMNPCRWRREPDGRPWPEWAMISLGMPGERATARSLLDSRPPANVPTTRAPARRHGAT